MKESKEKKNIKKKNLTIKRLLEEKLENLKKKLKRQNNKFILSIIIFCIAVLLALLYIVRFCVLQQPGEKLTHLNSDYSNF